MNFGPDLSLRLAHNTLDEAVLAAYAAVARLGHCSPAQAKVFEETGAGRRKKVD